MFFNKIVKTWKKIKKDDKTVLKFFFQNLNTIIEVTCVSFKCFTLFYLFTFFLNLLNIYTKLNLVI